MEIHRIVKSERTLGMHWGTFCDADEARGSRVEFGRVRRMMGVGKVWEDDKSVIKEEEGGKKNDSSNGRFVIADIGETLVFP
jgi:N-acyl-phosphatidylethanolamine-hydrolysing phospholipase D